MNYVIYGEEQYQVRKQIQAMISKEVGNQDDMNTVRYDALRETMEVILEDAQTIPFFADKKVIVVDHANFLSTNNDTEIDLQLLEDYLLKPLDSTILILSGEFAKMDSRKKIVKKIATLCKVTVCNRLDKDSITSYIREELHKRNIDITPKAFQRLCERLPFDIGTIQNELDKLALFDKQISEGVVNELVTRSLEEDVFLLVSAVVDKNIKRCFHIWEDFQVLNKDPIYLIALIASQFHLLCQVKVQMLKGNRNQDDIAKYLSVHPYRVKLAMPICQKQGIEDIMEVLKKLADLDQKMKAGRIDKKTGFEMFLLSVKGK